MLSSPIFIAVAALFLVACGIMLEHHLGPKPKLATDELFTAFDLIDAECMPLDEGYHDRVTALHEELWLWMDAELIDTDHLSDDLHDIIRRARMVNEKAVF